MRLSRRTSPGVLGDVFLPRAPHTSASQDSAAPTSICHGLGWRRTQEPAAWPGCAREHTGRCEGVLAPAWPCSAQHLPLTRLPASSPPPASLRHQAARATSENIDQITSLPPPSGSKPSRGFWPHLGKKLATSACLARSLECPSPTLLPLACPHL